MNARLAVRSLVESKLQEADWVPNYGPKPSPPRKPLPPMKLRKRKEAQIWHVKDRTGRTQGRYMALTADHAITRHLDNYNTTASVFRGSMHSKGMNRHELTAVPASKEEK